MPSEPKLELDTKLNQLYRDSIKKFEDRWMDGLYEDMDNANPALMAQIDAARGILDKVWIAVRHGRNGMQDFKKALQEWEILHLRLVGIAECGGIYHNAGKK